jgi:hypothetical protein
MLISLYSVALFVSAFLLFWVQPLFTKTVLPLLGGSPAVWNTAMMFFQVVLLAGYGYAHLLTRVAKTSRQFWIHVAVITVGFAFLPLGNLRGWNRRAITPQCYGWSGCWLLRSDGRSSRCRRRPRCSNRGSGAAAID